MVFVQDFASLISVLCALSMAHSAWDDVAKKASAPAMKGLRDKRKGAEAIVNRCEEEWRKTNIGHFEECAARGMERLEEVSSRLKADTYKVMHSWRVRGLVPAGIHILVLAFVIPFVPKLELSWLYAVLAVVGAISISIAPIWLSAREVRKLAPKFEKRYEDVGQKTRREMLLADKRAFASKKHSSPAP